MTADSTLPISAIPARLSKSGLRRMMGLVRLLYRVSRMPAYRELVFPQLPDVARFDPGHGSLMMGYDFHLTAAGPRLIEVNTNAGGAYLSWLSERQAGARAQEWLGRSYERRLLQSFLTEWDDFPGASGALKRVAIVDENPPEQPLYSEMKACRDWLREHGIDARIVAPEQLTIDPSGVCCDGDRVDLVYNRHCDFFLEEETMAPLRSAYLAGTVCLSPNPFAYGLLADKRRMILWSDREVMQGLGLEKSAVDLLAAVVPASRLLADCSADEIWSQRKSLVFKPVTRFGSRGVLLGKSITRKRFAELDPAVTLVQAVVPPSTETTADGQDFKVDWRLFAYRDRLVGVGARLYQGQVTNLRTERGGFAPVRLVD